MRVGYKQLRHCSRLPRTAASEGGGAHGLGRRNAHTSGRFWIVSRPDCCIPRAAQCQSLSGSFAWILHATAATSLYSFLETSKERFRSLLHLCGRGGFRFLISATTRKYFGYLFRHSNRRTRAWDGRKPSNNSSRPKTHHPIQMP